MVEWHDKQNYHYEYFKCRLYVNLNLKHKQKRMIPEIYHHGYNLCEEKFAWLYPVIYYNVSMICQGMIVAIAIQAPIR